eukprot:jgi/Mesen1/8580/ME000497S07989
MRNRALGPLHFAPCLSPFRSTSYVTRGGVGGGADNHLDHHDHHDTDHGRNNPDNDGNGNNDDNNNNCDNNGNGNDGDNDDGAGHGGAADDEAGHHPMHRAAADALPAHEVQFLVVLSCLISVSVNFSTFLVIGKTSPVTYQVLGHLKTCLVLAIGFVFLHNPFSWRNFAGISVAMLGMLAYSYCQVQESKARDAEKAAMTQACAPPAPPSPSPFSPPSAESSRESDPLLTLDGEKSGNTEEPAYLKRDTRN